MKIVISLTALLDINQFVDLQRDFNLHLTTKINALLELLSVRLCFSVTAIRFPLAGIDQPKCKFCLSYYLCVFIIISFTAIGFALAMFMFGVTEAHIYFSFVNTVLCKRNAKEIRRNSWLFLAFR